MNPDINENDLKEWASVDRRLTKIVDFIGSEVRLKSEMIMRLQTMLQQMTAALNAKDRELSDLREKLEKCQQNAEGTHQLMNKLLNDIEKYQKDVDWYRRTYEKRSLLGVLRSKYFRPPNPEDQQP